MPQEGGDFDVTLSLDRGNELWLQDFEAGLGDLATSRLWHLTTACSASLPGHSQPTALYAGLDASCSYDTPPSSNRSSFILSLAGTKEPVYMSFRYFLETDGGDLATVSTSPPDGSPGVTLASNQPEENVVELVDPSGSWRRATIDMSSFVGEDVIQLVLSFIHNGAADQAAGFYVDDLTIRSCFEQADVELADQGISSPAVYEACDSIVARNFEILPGGVVTFYAGKRVELGNGFSVAAGGSFTAAIGLPEA